VEMTSASQVLLTKPNRFNLNSAAALRLVWVGLFDAAMLWLILQLLQDGSYPLAAILAVMVGIITISFSFEQLKAYRWLSVGMSLAILFVLYPILYTFYLSTTNTSIGHILTKQQVIESLK